MTDDSVVQAEQVALRRFMRDVERAKQAAREADPEFGPELIARVERMERAFAEALAATRAFDSELTDSLALALRDWADAHGVPWSLVGVGPSA